MKIIKNMKVNFYDDQAISKANQRLNPYNGVKIISIKTGFLLLNCTPPWPTLGNGRDFNETQPINVCGTVPAFIHKYSRQGEQQPAKGENPDFRISDSVSQNPVSPFDWGCFCNNSSKKIVHWRTIGSRQKSDRIYSLPRCQKMVGPEAQSGHISFWNFNNNSMTSVSACTN